MSHLIFDRFHWNKRNANENARFSSDERSIERGRIFDHAFSRLVIGPGVTLFGACTSVFGLSALEGWLHLAKINTTSTFERTQFVTRYALANIIPSIVWDRIPAQTVVKALNLNPNVLGSESPRLSWRRTRLQSLRGSIAGTAILSQLVSLVQVSMKSQQDYSERLLQGKETPFNVASQKEVVVRLGGKSSNVTTLSMERWGRRNVFPIFESATSEIRQLVRRHGFWDENDGVPIYWRVDNGSYGDPDTWKGMRIPKQWLLETKNQIPKMLLLEADSVGKDSISSIFSSDMANNSDLDLHEATQGFYQLSKLVEADAPPHQVLRVLLVDADSIVTTGGGRKRSVRDYVTSLGLADIIIDARIPLLLAIRDWLEHRSWDKLKSGSWGKKKRPLIVETPSSVFFTSIRSALEPFGYCVMDVADAGQQYGSIQDIPILVDEDTSLATIHTVRSLLERKLTTPENICAFCGDQGGLVELAPGEESPIFTICSSDIYDGLFRLVRSLAIEGHSKERIQEHLDSYVHSAAKQDGKRLGFPSL
eukprot:scaffold374_cov124-Cylindrotheca_fusiformis.AAC.15